MAYRLAADALLWLHMAFIAFALAGAWSALRWRWLLWLQVPAAAWAVWVMASGRICPLTPLENHLRQMAGQAGYSGGFVEHYLLAFIYPDGLTRELQIGLGLVVVMANVLAYALLWRKIEGGNAAETDRASSL
jgi:hypothetical protein